MYECSNCGAVCKEPEFVYEKETGTNIAVCRVCGCGHYHPMKMLEKTVDRMDVYEKLVFVVMHLNRLREEFECMKKAIDTHLLKTEGEVRELFCELADADSYHFHFKLDKAYGEALTDEKANSLLNLLEERISR